MQFHKVKSLPKEPVPNSLYFLKANESVKIYLTDSIGFPYLVGDETHVECRFTNGMVFPVIPGEYRFQLFLCYHGRRNKELKISMPEGSVWNYVNDSYPQDWFFGRYYKRNRLLKFQGTLMVSNKGYFIPKYDVDLLSGSYISFSKYT